VLRRGLKHKPLCIEAVAEQQTVGLLPLALVSGRIFGRFLVSLPYLNTGGVVAAGRDVACQLIDEAVKLADAWDVRYLELRHEHPVDHPALRDALTSKYHMRLALPAAADELWKSFDPKVRNQIRKAEKCGLTVAWGGADLLPKFYRVFAHNMRDLGTPVFPVSLFRSVVETFPGDAEVCVVSLEGRPVAGALVVHGRGITEVPSASSLREFNSTCANMLMYWHLLRRAAWRGQQKFDFGRSTADSNTFRFKKQWGAQPEPAVWQYYLRKGTIGDMRPEGGKYDRLIRLWKKLPVWLTRLIGPPIVRGIP
jgi:FemAB-related protein (PEP-CTERM system-associated)